MIYLIIFFIIFVISLFLAVDLRTAFQTLKLNPLQNQILKRAGIISPNDKKFKALLRSALDYCYHAEYFFKNPSKPRQSLILEDWQREELKYCQFGEGYDKNGMAIRKDLAINSPRGFGKSVFSTIVAVEFALHIPYIKIALFSTSQDQANDLMDKVKFFITHSIFAFMINKKINSKTHLGLINGSEIKAFPQSEVTIRGYHPQIKIIDEKARIKREILESAIRPMGRKDLLFEIGISTPFGMNNNHYEETAGKHAKYYHTKILKPTDVSWVDDEKLKEQIQKMGERYAKQELLAEFLEDGKSIFKLAWIEMMLHVGNKAKGIEPLTMKEEGELGNVYILGTDFGKHRDYTGICIIHVERTGRIVIDLLERHRGVSYNVAIERIRILCNKFNVKLIVPDGTGVGIAIMEQLEANVKVPIYQTKLKKKDKQGLDQYRLGFIFTNTSKLNLVDELVKIMMNNKIKCPHHHNIEEERNPLHIFKVLENEMVAFTFVRTAAGNIVFGHPEDGHSHDDTLISVMLAVWGIRYLKVNQTALGGAPNQRNTTQNKSRMPQNRSQSFFGGGKRR
jgi:hypothetical protein